MHATLIVLLNCQIYARVRVGKLERTKNKTLNDPIKLLNSFELVFPKHSLQFQVEGNIYTVET